MTEKLMKAIYSDPTQTITLTTWADTVAVDPRDNLLIAVRLGGYPEVTAGLVNAVSGGGTLSVQLDGETLVCTPQQGRYSKEVSRDGTYAVAAPLWDNQSARKQGEKQQTEEMEGKEQKEKTDKAQEARVYYLACPVRDKTALYHEIDKVSTIPMLPEFRDYMINELQARDMLAPCRVYTTGEPFAIWRLTCTPDDQNIADVLTAGLKAGVIRIPSTWPCQPDAFTEINGVAGYLRAFGSVIASRIRGQFQPLYDPAQEPLSEGVLGLDQFVAQTAGYHLYGAQLAAAEALRRRLADPPGSVCSSRNAAAESLRSAALPCSRIAKAQEMPAYRPLPLPHDRQMGARAGGGHPKRACRHRADAGGHERPLRGVCPRRPHRVCSPVQGKREGRLYAPPSGQMGRKAVGLYLPGLRQCGPDGIHGLR